MTFNDWVAALSGRWASVSKMPTVDRHLPEMSEGLVDDWCELMMGHRLSVPAHDPYDPLQRFVVLNAFNRLSRMSFENDIPEDAEWAREWSRQRLFEALQLLRVSDIDDIDRLRWEISAAAASRAWLRVQELFDRWRAVQEAERHLIERLRGRVLWLSVWIDRDPPQDRFEDLWLPGMSVFGPATDFMVFAKAISILQTEEGAWPGDPHLTADEQERLVDALAAFRKSGHESDANDILATAIASCCEYLLGAHNENPRSLAGAADGYYRLVGNPPIGELPPDVFSNRLYECSVTCLKRARLFAKAEKRIKEWLAHAGDRPEIWEHLAEVQSKQNDLEGARKSILNAIANNDKYATDWKASLLVGLATRPDPVAAVEAALADEKAVNPGPSELAVALTGRYWPPFLKLSRYVQDLWVQGTRLRHDPAIVRQLTEVRLQSAGHSFALAVENELRTRAFDQFVRANLWLAVTPTRADERVPSFDLIRYARQRKELTLGSMSIYLRDCQTSADEVLKALAVWLGRRSPALLRLAPQLERIVGHRSLVSHRMLNETQLADLENLTESLLSILSEIDFADVPGNANG